MATNLITTPRLIIAFVACFSSTAVLAVDDFYFWPTAIRRGDAENRAVLFTWPEYEVLLQTKNEASYSSAKISDELAEQFARIFTPEEGSPIKIYRNAMRNEWGLTIPGGVFLRQENLKLLPVMATHFSNCLSTLGQDDLHAMELALYTPSSLFGEDGIFQLSDEHKAIAASMLTSFQTTDAKTV